MALILGGAGFIASAVWWAASLHSKVTHLCNGLDILINRLAHIEGKLEAHEARILVLETKQKEDERE